MFLSPGAAEEKLLSSSRPAVKINFEETIVARREYSITIG